MDAIHLNRATLVEGRFNPAAERRFNNARADRDYESAFREAGFGAIGDDPAGVAARIAASAAREPLVAALDDWAICAADERRRAWVLGVARKADPDAWRGRARDPAAWADRTALAELARTAPVASAARALPGRVGGAITRPRRGRDRLPGAGAPGAPGRFLGRLDPGPGVAGGRRSRSRGRPLTGGR